MLQSSCWYSEYAGNTSYIKKRKVTFLLGKSSFSGHVNEDIEAFIDAINVYKDCLSNSEEPSVQSLSNKILKNFL